METPEPPPHHDRSGNTYNSLARVAGDRGPANGESSCHRVCGNPPDAHRALPTARTRDQPPPLPKTQPATLPSPAL